MRLTCVVDNTVLDGRLWGEHGLSLLLESQGKRILYDCGNSGDVLLHNLRALGVVPASIDAVVLSHGHDDHGGGLAALAAVMPAVPLYAHPEAFNPRFSGNRREAAGIAMPAAGSLLRLQPVTEPTLVAAGVRTSGEIWPRPYPEGRGATHVVPAGDGYVPDPYRDDLSLFLDSQAGTVVVCGCAHAGVLNVLEVAATLAAPIVAVIGGTHLRGLREADLKVVADYLDRLQCELYLGHCTGFSAVTYLSRRMPQRVHAFGAGWSMDYPSEAVV